MLAKESPQTETNYTQIVESICNAAKLGLNGCYIDPFKQLPYTTRLKDCNQVKVIGKSLRYAAISQIGIARWIDYHAEDKKLLPNLFPAILSRISEIQHIGDAALVLWAAIESREPKPDRFIDVVLSLWPHQRDLCNAVELGWVVQAAVLCAKSENSQWAEKIRPLLDDAYSHLKSLYCSQHGLFRRHNRKGRFKVGRTVSCFADQIYPIIAMSSYGAAFNDDWSIRCAASVVESICKFQGPLGQWMWHYDVDSGKICEEYPIFSVHQDAMAPMAIFAADKTAGTNHTSQIELGMRWLWGQNELKETLVLPDQGIIWRDIERRELPKFSRIARSVCCICRADGMHRMLSKPLFGFKVNRECRPYHLGWILYAWADYMETSQR